MANNYLSNILDLNDVVIDLEPEKYMSYTFGVATLMRESVQNSEPEDLVNTLEYGIAMVAEIIDVLNPALTYDLEYFTELKKNLVAWNQSVQFANSLKI